ncbi:MAG: hypothetical protein ACK5RG_15355 [Cyclobacteriaceae bacterium]|jgi:hypothetical protein
MNETMKHIAKYFWVYSILLIIIGIYLDSLSNTVEIVGQQINVTKPDGTKELQTVYSYRPIMLIPKIISSTLYSLAVSLLLLFLIDKRIDIQESQKNKEEIDKLNTTIHKNIFSGVLKKFIPEEIFNKVQEDIFDTDVIRKNAKWTYEIKRNGNSFDVIQNISYELHNLNNFEIVQELPFTLSSTNAISTIELTSIKEVKLDYTENVLNDTNRKVSIPKGSYTSIHMVVKNIYKTPAVVDNHISLFSIIGLEITTTQPEDVIVKLIPTFTKGLISSSAGNTLTQYNKVSCILKGQGLTYIIENRT